MTYTHRQLTVAAKPRGHLWLQSVTDKMVLGGRQKKTVNNLLSQIVRE